MKKFIMPVLFLLVLALGTITCSATDDQVVSNGTSTYSVSNDSIVASGDETVNLCSISTLSTPQNLRWNVDEYGDVKKGHVSWDVVDNCDGEYDITLYRDGEEVFYTNWCDLYDYNGTGRISVDFIHANVFDTSGTFVFTVQAVGDGEVYNDSEIAISSNYNFVAPNQKLSTPNRIFWTKDGKVKHKPVSNAGEYLYTVYDQNNHQVGYTWYIPKDSADGYIYKDLDWYFKDIVSWRPDLTAVYVTVTALTGDIEVIQNSDESIASSRYDIKKQQIKADSVLNIIMDDLNNSEMTATEALDSLIDDMKEQEISNTDLAISMIKDEDIVASIDELEQQVCAETGINVSVENSSADSNYLENKGINPEKISVVGAALNSDNSQDVNISFSKADDSISVDEAFYKNSVALEINIDGVKNSGKLDIPIQMTMPIPAGVLPERFIILHYHSDGTIEKIRPGLTQINNEDYATFVLTSFSPFVFCNEDLGVSYDDGNKELTVSGNIDIYDATLFVVAYKNGQMVSVESVPLSISAGEEDTLFLNNLDTASATEIKVMIWDNASMTPVIETNIINAF